MRTVLAPTRQRKVTTMADEPMVTVGSPQVSTSCKWPTALGHPGALLLGTGNGTCVSLPYLWATALLSSP